MELVCYGGADRKDIRGWVRGEDWSMLAGESRTYSTCLMKNSSRLPERKAGYLANAQLDNLQNTRCIASTKNVTVVEWVADLPRGPLIRSVSFDESTYMISQSTTVEDVFHLPSVQRHSVRI